MSKFGFLTLAALALGLLGLTGTTASAFPLATPPALNAPAAPDLVIPARHGYGGWNGNYYRGPRFNNYNRPRYNYRRFYNGYPYGYYGRRCYGWNGYCNNGFYGGPFIGLGFYVAPQRYAYAGSRHVNWCRHRYKSYKPRSNTWVSYSGRVRQCISPYSR